MISARFVPACEWLTSSLAGDDRPRRSCRCPRGVGVALDGPSSLPRLRHRSSDSNRPHQCSYPEQVFSAM